VEGESATAALDLRLEGGRWFQPDDRDRLPESIVVNRALADRDFGGHAIGRAFEIATFDGATRYPVTVIGVVAPSPGRPSSGPAMLLPSALSSNRIRTIWLRPRADQAMDAAVLRGVVRAIDPRVPIDAVTTAADHLSPYDPDETGAVTGLLTLGVVALLLSAAGLYGLLAYVVSLRTKEFGIRVALGARPASLLRLVVRHAVVSVGIGLACGVAIAVATGLILQSSIYGMRAVDPLALAGAGAVLVMVMGVAAAAPARRTARADPIIALRQD
jgi:ABC-type antimicrobial peptide transport system permease subunit